MTVFYISSRLPVTRIFWSFFFVRILKIVIVARIFPREFPREVPREQSTLPLVVLNPLPTQTGRFYIWYFEIFPSYGKRMSITLENLWYVKQESIMRHADTQTHSGKTRFRFHDWVHVLEFEPSYLKLLA